MNYKHLLYAKSSPSMFLHQKSEVKHGVHLGLIRGVLLSWRKHVPCRRQYEGNSSKELIESCERDCRRWLSDQHHRRLAPFLFFSLFFLSVINNNPLQFSKSMKADWKSSVVLRLIDSLVASTVKLGAIHAVLSQGAVGEDVFDKKMPGQVWGELPEVKQDPGRTGRARYSTQQTFALCLAICCRPRVFQCRYHRSVR